MNLAFYIARRYLFAKKRHHVINLISGVAVAGVAIATVAMVCTLSVFNGFQDLVAKQFTAFDPEIKITALNGKVFNAFNDTILKIRSMPEIDISSKSLEDQVMVQYKGRQIMVTLKGVENNFEQLTKIDDILLGNGSFKLHDNTVDYAIMGVDIIGKLNCGLFFTDALEVYAPQRGKRINLTNPSSNFNKGYLYSPGKVFMLNQPKYDENYILTSIDFAREMFQRDSAQVSSLEIKLKQNSKIEETKQKIKNLAGENYKVEDRYEQQADMFKIMEIEKFISFLFLSFILVVACFNVVGSLSMLIIDKKEDVATLRSLGANDRLISNIFILEGALIAALGAISGIIIGVVLCLAQQKFGILNFGKAAEHFVVSGYPMSVKWEDVILVFATVLLIGIGTLAFPVSYLTKRLQTRGK